ncbi:MAG: fumarate hydratase [Pedobacter sp.]|nr:MAG: fumarate hydratase [Pedobacter sp.]
MRNALVLAVIVVFLTSACRRLPDIQGEGNAAFQGVWNQDSVLNSEKLLNYTQHKFRFSCDSFYVDLVTHSKANYYADSCFNNGIWKEYAKGVYQVRADSLFLLGTFTKSNYKQKLSGCYQIGQYIKSFKILNTDSSKIVLESTDNQRIVELILKQPIVCVPQEL